MPWIILRLETPLNYNSIMAEIFPLNCNNPADGPIMIERVHFTLPSLRFADALRTLDGIPLFELRFYVADNLVPGPAPLGRNEYLIRGCRK